MRMLAGLQSNPTGHTHQLVAGGGEIGLGFLPFLVQDDGPSLKSQKRGQQEAFSLSLPQAHLYVAPLRSVVVVSAPAPLLGTACRCQWRPLCHMSCHTCNVASISRRRQQCVRVRPFSSHPIPLERLNPWRPQTMHHLLADSS